MSGNDAQELAPVTGAIAPGIALAAARRARNLGIDEVARQLRLSVAQVEAIEAGANERLPAPVFVRGFIRNYARLLHMDADALLKDREPAASRAFTAPPTGVPYPQGGKSRLPHYALAALVLLGGIAWYEFYWTNDVKSPAPAVSPAAPARDANAISAVEAKPDAAVADASLPAAIPMPKSATRLHFAFKGASWVEVRDRTGAALLSQTQPAGSERTLEGVPPFSLVIGNAEAVHLTYGDKRVDLVPYINNTVARMKLE
jgi:cytoskeleton protein RodZ